MKRHDSSYLFSYRINATKYNTMYDFKNLSPIDFEELVRDVIQVKYGRFVESFTTGRDGGIDLRFSKTPNEEIIIQCKHYSSGFAKLYNRLKKECEAISGKGYKRYILATSVGLTPMNKEKIKNLFEPLITNNDDILGKDDLNNVISNNEQLELTHFKLWFSSTTVFKRILNNRVHLQSQIESDEINEKVKYYVQNNSYSESLKILKKNNFVIISGIPGIGKTTLARVLIFNLSLNSDYQFINISSNIDDGFDLLKDNKRQIFLFDDFLGRNFLKSSFSSQSEKGIVQLISRVRKSKNKLLIFTTREYILNQALIEYEHLNRSINEFDKCIIDLEDYTSLIKAKILYNHLYFNKVSKEHIVNLLENNNHLTVINHQNYNPRIIQLATSKANWKHIEAGKFATIFLKYLDDPNEIWKTAYQFHISKLSQIIVKLIYVSGTPILYDDLYHLVNKYLVSNQTIHESFDEIEFDKSLNELENTFIKTLADDYGIIVIDFQNPSIKDFLFYFLDKNKKSLYQIIQCALFSNQFYKTVTFQDEENSQYTKRHYMSSLEPLYIDLFKDYLSKQESIITRTVSYSSKKRGWSKFPYSKPKKLYMLFNRGRDNKIIRSYVLRELNHYFSGSHAFNSKDSYYLYALIKGFQNEVKLDVNKLISEIGGDLYFKHNLDDFRRLEDLYPIEFERYFNEKEKEILDTIVKSELDSMDDENMESTKETLEELQNEYDVDLNEIIEDIESKITEKEEYNEKIIGGKLKRMNSTEEIIDKAEIKLMFSSLLEEDA